MALWVQRTIQGATDPGLAAAFEVEQRQFVVAMASVTRLATFNAHVAEVSACANQFVWSKGR